MPTYIEKHMAVTKDTLNVDHNSRETFQHVKFMNPDNIYYGTFTSDRYTFEDTVTQKQYNVLLSSGNAVLSGEDGLTAVVDDDQIKDDLTDESASFPRAVPSMKLLSALNDSLHDIVFELSSRAAMLSGGNIISGENFIQQLSTDVLSVDEAFASSMSASALSVPTFSNIMADGTTLSSILSSTGADVSALEEQLRQTSVYLDSKIDTADLSIRADMASADAELNQKIDDLAEDVDDNMQLSVSNLQEQIETGDELLAEALQLSASAIYGKIDEVNLSIRTDMTNANEVLDSKIDGVESELGSVSANLNGKIDGVESLLEDVSVDLAGRITSLDDDLHSNYYTDGEVDSISSTLSSNLSVQLVNESTPTEGYLKTYTLYQGSRVAGTIDIPKDFIVKSSAISTVTEYNVPYDGAVPGDKYIDLVINVSSEEAGQHVYIPVNSLVNVYTGSDGNTINVVVTDDHVISAEVKDGGISTQQLADKAVTAAKLKYGGALISSDDGTLSVRYAEINKSGIISYTNNTGSSSSIIAATPYFVKSWVSSYSQPKGNYLSSNALDNYYKMSETSSAQEIADAVNSKSAVSVDNQLSDVNIVHISNEEYAQLLVDGSVSSNWLYVVSGDNEDVYGQRIINLAPGTDLSDAVNYQQLLSGLDTKQPAGNYYTASEVDQHIAALSAVHFTNDTSAGNIVLAAGDDSILCSDKQLSDYVAITGSKMVGNLSVGSIEHANIVAVYGDQKIVYQSGGSASSKSVLNFPAGRGNNNTIATEQWANSNLQSKITANGILSGDGNGNVVSAEISLDGYATEDWVNEHKSAVSVDNVHTDINVLHISEKDYAQKLIDGDILSNWLYVVSSDSINAYGRQIKNLSAATDISDAVNYEQMLSGLDTKQDAGNYLSSNALDNYYKMSETSSSQEIADGIDALSAVPETRTINSKPLSDDIILSASDISALSYIQNIEWAQLTALQNSSTLVPGQQYRITDYVAMTKNMPTTYQSANKPFDIIVVADTISSLNEVAHAARHDGDAYFPLDTRFEAWQIWYSLKNDTSRFAWARSNGKGVIYRMIDEYGNDVPYDFKGIQFKAYEDSSGIWRYTFDSGAMQNNTDFSIVGGATSNVIKPYANELAGGKLDLNIIVFNGSCSSNNFGTNCSQMTFGKNCICNTFGNSCSWMTFGENCRCNTVGNESNAIEFGNDFSCNAIGNDCTNIAAGNGFTNNIINSCCSDIRFCQQNTVDPKDYISNVVIESGNTFVTFALGGTTSSNAPWQNVTVKHNIRNKNTIFAVIYNNDDGGQQYDTVYQPAGSQTISI